MKEFVKRLPYLQAAKKSAAIHTTVAELIKDVTRSESFIETITAEHGKSIFLDFWYTPQLDAFRDPERSGY